MKPTRTRSPQRAKSTRGLSAGTTPAEKEKYLHTLRWVKSDVGRAQRKLSDLVADKVDGVHPSERTRASEKAFAYSATRLYYGVLSDVGAGVVKTNNALLGGLREYKLEKKDRAIVERALTTMHIGLEHLSGRDSDTVAEEVARVLGGLGRAADVVLAALEKDLSGDACSRAECLVAGCFRVVNAGDFDSRVMRIAVDQAAEAARLVAGFGYSGVCYGDVYVVRSLGKKSMLAFYSNSEDRLYIKAQSALGGREVQTAAIVHELGHRLHRRFLDEGKMEQLFRRWSDDYFMKGSSAEDPTPFPSHYARTSADEMVAEIFREVVAGTPSDFHLMKLHQIAPPERVR